MNMSRRKPNCATSRLKQDYLRLKKDPVPYITAEPVPSNILEWHYVVAGPETTPYEGGYYHGKLVFSRGFPFTPPSIFMITPSGRFKTNTKLCLSISDYHPETWNPAWSVSTILTALLSFMTEKSPTLGSVETSDYEKRQFAYRSLEFNLRNAQFKDLFPDITRQMQEKVALRKKAQKNATGAENQKKSAANRSVLHSYLTNLAVLVCFAVFALTVKYVIDSGN